MFCFKPFRLFERPPPYRVPPNDADPPDERDEPLRGLEKRELFEYIKKESFYS